MRLTLCASLLLAFSAVAQDPGLFQSKKVFSELARSQPGSWVARWHPATVTPKAIYGVGFPLKAWRENTLEHAREHARRALEEHRNLLGLGTSTWRERIGSRMGRTWSFTFDQYFGGLQVIGGRADVRINMKGVIAMLGSVAFPIAPNFDTTPTIAQELAEAIAQQKIGEPTGVPQPAPARPTRLVIWGDLETVGAGRHELAWEVPVSNVDANGRGPIGRYYIDARTGGVLQFVTDKHECSAACHHGVTLPAPVPTTVTVMAWTRTGDDAWSALVNTPLQNLQVSVPGIGTRTTDANGQFTIDIASPVTITIGQLDGVHHQAITGNSSPSVSQLVNPGVATTIQIGSSSSSTNQAAHPTTSYWVDRANEWVRGILDLTIPSNLSAMNTASNVAPRVNISSTCNAYYTNNTINFYQQGGGCANTAFSTVVVHEWGHGLDERFGGISNTNAEGVSEGWGDILGMYLVDSPILGSGFQTAGVGIRNGNNTYTYPYSGSSPHAAGQVWMGFAWKLRENLRATYGTPQAIAISDDIVISSIVANATTRPDCVLEVFIADDDDGNLMNGVPHYAELSAAAITKNLPYPVQQVAYVTHTPLASTNIPITPRKVTCEAAEVSSGSITAVTMYYSANNGPTQVRNMHPNGTPNRYEAMLPGLQSGNMRYYITATHSSGATVRSPESGWHTYGVDGSFQTFWSDNFDGAALGWTHQQVSTQDDWQLGDPAGKSGTSYGVNWADPQLPASGPRCWANDLGNTINGQLWNGSYKPNVYNRLRSPIIDCTGRTGVALRFKRWLNVEEAIYDQATILVNGQQVWQNQQFGHTIDTSWVTVQYPLPMADNNPAVQIEFRLQSDGGLELGGWNIDDLELGEIIPVSFEATLTMLPEQAVQNSTINLSVQTQTGPRPALIVIGTDAGPTLVPNVPTILVGNVFAQIPVWTDATGSYSSTFPAPPISTVVGATWFSQALTLDGSGTQIVTSNQFLNLFTMTP